jgi:hypothetical protein
VNVIGLQQEVGFVLGVAAGLEQRPVGSGGGLDDVRQLQIVIEDVLNVGGPDLVFTVVGALEVEAGFEILVSRSFPGVAYGFAD